MTLAAVKQNLGWGCRPRGRKRRTANSRRNQSTRASWLGAQGV